MTLKLFIAQLNITIKLNTEKLIFLNEGGAYQTVTVKFTVCLFLTQICFHLNNSLLKAIKLNKIVFK